MSKSKRDLTGDEKRLWREVAKTVRTRRPLPRDDEDEAPIAPAKAAPSVAPKAASPSPKATAKPKPVVLPANRSAEKKVRRGKLEIDAKLDLHGHTQDRAQAALERFLHAAQGRDARTVIVITGVGRGGEGIIKRRFIDWIAARELRNIVSGYAPAHRLHGGGGAFYVFLKRAT